MDEIKKKKNPGKIELKVLTQFLHVCGDAKANTAS